MSQHIEHAFLLAAKSIGIDNKKSRPDIDIISTKSEPQSYVAKFLVASILCTLNFSSTSVLAQYDLNKVFVGGFADRPQFEAPQVTSLPFPTSGRPARKPLHQLIPDPSRPQKEPASSIANTSVNDPCTDPVSSDGNINTSHPVIIATGEKVQVENDVIAGATHGLGLTRTYKSYDATVKLFGQHWSSDYDYPALVFSGCYNPGENQCRVPLRITAAFPDGSKYYYQKIGDTSGYYDYGDYVYQVLSSSALGSFTKSGNNWVLGTLSADYTYSNNKIIQSIFYKDTGVNVKFNYGTDPQRPASITSNNGQNLFFTYDSATKLVTAVTDPSGQTWTYGYTGTNLTSVSSPGANPDVRTYIYDSPVDPALLTGIAINGVRYSIYSYQSDKKVKTSGLVGGEEQETFVYGAATTTVTDAKGGSTTYNFVGAQGGLKISSVSRSATSSCPAMNAQTFYDAYGWKSYTIDWNGNRTNYSFDAAGKLLSTTRAANTSSAATEVNTWANNLLTQKVFKDSAQSSYASVNYQYITSAQGINNLASETWYDIRTGAQRQINYAYAFGSNGLLASMSRSVALPGDTATTTLNFDASGNLSSVVNPLNQATAYANYNGLGLPGQIIDSNNVVTELTYNPQGTLASTIRHLSNGDRKTSYRYDHNRQLVVLGYGDDHVTRLQYTPSERLEYVGNTVGEYVHYVYDAPSLTWTISSSRKVPTFNGSVWFGFPSGSFSTTTQLDSLGRTILKSGNAGQRWSTSYDNNGNVKTRTDAGSRTTSFDYDALNRLVRVIRPDTGTIQYGYDAEGQLASIIDPRSVMTTYSYNGFGDRLSQISPDTGATIYTYDSAGRMSTEAKANGVTISYTWDKLNRMRSRTSSQGNITETFTYDEGIYGIGHLTRITDASGQTTFSYNAAGELVRQQTTIAASSFTTTWNYDAAGRLTSLGYPSNQTLQYGYDGAGRLESILRNGNQRVAINFLYQPATDLRYGWIYGNGLPMMRTLDTDGRATQLSGGSVFNLNIGWNATDTIASINDTIYPVLNTSFSYDLNDRLAGVARSNDNQSLSWDRTGNRTSITRKGTTVTSSLPTSSNRLISTTDGNGRAFTYDSVGNVTVDDFRSFTYDPFNRQASLTTTLSGNTTLVSTHLSNALNQRVSKTVGSTTRRFIYGPQGELLSETGPNPTDYVWLDGQLMGIIRNNVFYAGYSDQIGRPQLLTNAAGQPVWRAVNAAFDRAIAQDSIGGLNVGFPGQYQDTESGYWYNWNRYYTQSAGRYTQSDPIGIKGGVGTYTYANGNPTSNIDFFGLCDCSTVLPDGKTVGQVVQNAVANIRFAASQDFSGLSELGAFYMTVKSNGPIDFKKNFGPDPTGSLGAAGNFAYGAIASGIGYSQSFAEFGAGFYASQVGKSNPNNPFGEDDSAAKNLPAGYATNGCKK